MTELEAMIRAANPVPESGPDSEVAVRSDVFTDTPVLTEARGIYTAVVSHTSGRLFLCLAGAGPARPPHGTVVWFTSIPVRPGPDEISFPHGSTGSVGNAARLRLRVRRQNHGVAPRSAATSE